MHELASTVVELVAVALLVLALGLWVGAVVAVPAGLAASGVSLLAVGWLLERRSVPTVRSGDQ